MKVDVLEQELKQWGEIIITTSTGDTFEIHTGDNVSFDTQQNTMKLTTPEAEYIIDVSGVEEVKKHYGHKVQ